ncbi:hypothetical protein QBC47DRAFT_366668, partial [Echria macrotheca]
MSLGGTVDSVCDDQTRTKMRNRLAAQRYRDKLQLKAAELEEGRRQVLSKHESLVAVANQLSDEVYALKNELFQHSSCDCPPIQRYLSDELARRFSCSDGVSFVGGDAESQMVQPAAWEDAYTDLREAEHASGFGQCQSLGGVGLDHKGLVSLGALAGTHLPSRVDMPGPMSPPKTLSSEIRQEIPMPAAATCGVATRWAGWAVGSQLGR